MFAVEPKPEGAPGPSKKWVIDRERNTSLQVIVGLGRSDGQAFILVNDNITIPFNVMFDPGHVDPVSADPYYVMRLQQLWSKRRNAPARIRDVRVRRRDRRKALEAVSPAS